MAFGSMHATENTDETVAFKQQVAAHVAIAVENGINFDRSQRYAGELRQESDRRRLLLEINNVLVSELDYPSVLKAISNALRRVVRHDQVSVALFDREAGELRLEMVYGETAGITRPGVVLPLDQSPSGITFRQGVVGVFRRADFDALTAAAAAAFGVNSLQAMCCVPLTTRHGPLGTLNVVSTDESGFRPSEVELLAVTGVQISIAVENAAAYHALAERNDRLAEANAYLADEIRIEHEFGNIIGSSLPLTRVLKDLSTVAPTDATVLILGETGTGKELAARAIHALSARRSRTFVRMSGAAVPSGLLESELFGYEKGAFTGAAASRIGRIELAHHGTLFLDEVADIPLDLQPKLLRVLQEREFERLGSSHTRRVDVRLIAATNRDLEAMMEAGTFRSDLYYRLNVFPIELPPLRARREDIPALARYFTERFAQRMRRPMFVIEEDALAALCRWHWPGNIRELENVIERAVILSPGKELRVPVKDLQAKPRRPVRHDSPTLHDSEREAILEALRQSGGVVAGPSGAASRLGLKRTTLQSMMRKLGIRRPSY
jgi:formate hydrogenlyase transcriptional activator